jgi:Bacterial SH3 domain
MDLSGIPKPALIIASLTGLAAIAGGTLAISQPPTSDPIAVSSTQTSTQKPEPTTSKPVISKATTANPDGRSPATQDSETVKPETQQPTEPIKKQPDKKQPDQSEPEPTGTQASRTVESCEITMARIDDPNSPINIRSKPNTKTPDTIVGTAKNGTYVSVLEEQDGWFKISTPQKGWIAKRLTVHGCNTKSERINFGRNETATVLRDEFIGTGTHDYRLRLLKGQKLRVFAQKGPLPTILAPDGHPLHTLSDEGSVWSGTLTTTGDYNVIFESNFKGYKYAAEIEAKS